MSAAASNARRKALDRLVSGPEPLDQLATHGALSRPGMAWIKASLDPFHDYEVSDLEGIPDLETEPTLVVRTQQSVVVSSGTSTTPWDANVVLMPVDYSTTNSASNLACHVGDYFPTGIAGGHMPGTFAERLTTDRRMDGLQVSYVDSGDRTFGVTDARARLGLDSYMTVGSGTDLVNYRLVSSGFEVVNTTAPLNRAGACTVYELGNGGERCDFNLEIGSDETRIGSCRAFRMPPTDAAEAKQCPGARTWHAEEGCYVVAKHRDEMGFSGLNKRDWVYAQSSADEGVSWITHKAGRQITTTTAQAPNLETSGCASHCSNMNTCGAYFTGLSPETTLQVTWRCIFERLPGTFDLQNLALASPSAPFDPRALELYSHITRLLPPGVPVNYNEAGKYFRMIAAAIRRAAKATLPLLPSVETALVASGNPVAAAAVESFRAGVRATGQAQAMSKKQKKKAIQNFGKP